MRFMFRLHLAILVAVASLVPSDALAYIDPGTGSMLVQSLLGAIAAALVFGRTIWQRAKGFFRRDGKDDRRESSQDRSH